MASMKVRYAHEDLSLVETDQAHRLRLPVAVVLAVRRKIRVLRQAFDERDLYAMKSLHYEKLQGELGGIRSLRINDQWRLLVEIDQACDPLEIVIKEISNHYR
jgi:proteic killer suppression protein